MFSYEYHNGYNGCSTRKCPCRLWVNCKTYIDIQKQQTRLKKKDINEAYKPIIDWYNQHFKEIEMGNSIPNG